MPLWRFCSAHNTYENYELYLGTTNAKIAFECACAAGQRYVPTSVLIWQMNGVSPDCLCRLSLYLFLSLMTMIVKPEHFESTGQNSYEFYSPASPQPLVGAAPGRPNSQLNYQRKSKSKRKLQMSDQKLSLSGSPLS